MQSTRLLCLVALTLLAVSLPLQAADPGPAAAGSPNAAEAAAPAAEIVPLAELCEDATAAEAPAVDEPLLLDSWDCPWYTQICSADAQCDGYCGGQGLGVCLPFGGVRKCCSCNA